MKSKHFHSFQTCYEHHDAENLLEPIEYQQPLILDFRIVQNHLKKAMTPKHLHLHGTENPLEPKKYQQFH